MKLASVEAIAAALEDAGVQYLVVLQMWADAHRETPVDVFVREPFDFDAEHAAAHQMALPSGRELPIIRRAVLIEMKQNVGRSTDLIDVHELQRFPPD